MLGNSDKGRLRESESYVPPLLQAIETAGWPPEQAGVFLLAQYMSDSLYRTLTFPLVY
jgi:hypothetical protein